MRNLFLLTLLFWVCFANPASADVLLAANKNSASLTFIDLETNQIIRTLKTGVGPHEVAVSPDNNYAAVANYGDRQLRGNSVSLIDLKLGKVINTTTDSELASPHSLKWLSDSRHLIVTAENKNQIVKLNPFSGKITAKADTLAKGSHMLALAPDEKTVAVANLFDANISLIDMETFQVVKKINTGEGAEGIDYSSDGKTIWVANRSEDSVSVIDTQSLKVVKLLASKSFPIRVKITPDRQYVLAVNAYSNSVSIFDYEQKKLVINLPLSSKAEALKFPIGIEISPDSNTAYVAHTGSDKVSVIDLNTLSRTGIISAGQAPDGLGLVLGKLEFVNGTP